MGRECEQKTGLLFESWAVLTEPGFYRHYDRRRRRKY